MCFEEGEGYIGGLEQFLAWLSTLGYQPEPSSAYPLYARLARKEYHNTLLSSQVSAMLLRLPLLLRPLLLVRTRRMIDCSLAHPTLLCVYHSTNLLRWR